MITYGILLIIIGLVVWGIARAVTAPAFLIIVGEVVGAIGFVLLLVGLVLLVVNGGVAVPAAAMLIGPVA